LPQWRFAVANESSSSEIRIAPKRVSLEGDSCSKNSPGEGNRETRIYAPPPQAGSAEATAVSPLVGAKIGRYVIAEWRGQGGYGVVYRAHDSQTGEDVAIKVLREELCDAVAHRAGFEKEAATAMRLSHANLVQVYGLEHDQERRPYIVEQYIDGGSLYDWARAKPRTADDVVAMMIPVAEAVAYLHRSRLFHRDLKPNNILLDRTGKAYVSDFGLAIHESELTVREGEVAGTFGYMAPEQIRGRTKRVDGRTDIWSLGVILYELLSGRLPFGGVSRPSTSAEYYALLSEAIEENDPEPLRTFVPELSRELEDICLRCLEKEKRHRFKTGDDLAEALRRFRDRKAGGTVDTELLVASVAIPTVVPKGLRSFEQADETFFLDLLPGPRDRDGLPLCVSFWKERLGTVLPIGRLDVCVIYGPSGSGKSSLVKAGVVPQLTDDVRVISVECNAHDTEARTASALRQMLLAIDSSLPANSPLPELCKRLQQGLPGQKVVLVLDQFEQWLHSHPQAAGTELAAALQCCNGTTLQALLLVRDDFWMPLSRFTDELSISLREGENCAAVDLFDRAHARKVLMLFGRAYGRLPPRETGLSPEQTAFLNRAIDELAESDRIICVRLSLFADLMRTRPWTIAELEAVGGARGVGVKFLEEKFGPQAPAIYRSQRAAAQRVLAALLPPAGSQLRGQMRTIEQLRSSAELDERSFQSLLRLLDEDLKLITPTTPAGEADFGRAAGGQQATAQYYQLTHDYLVPALGRWLTTELRRTRHGQALLRLRERAEDWNRRPEPRRLPTLAEWLAISALVGRKLWSADERRMMRAANRRIGLWAGAVAVCALAVVVFAWEATGRNRARELRDQVVNFATSQVPAVLAAVEARPRWARPLLENAYRDEFASSGGDLSQTDPRQFRRRLHLSLALSRWDSGKLDYVLDQIAELEPEDLPAVIEMTRPRQQATVAKAWPRLEQMAIEGVKSDGGQALAVASVLAGLAPDDERWDQVAGPLTKQLVAARATQFSTWLKHLSPVHAQLRAPLLELLQNHVSTGGERTQVLEAIARYAADEPVTLVAAVEEAAISELPLLHDASRRVSAGVVDLAGRRISDLSAKTPPAARTSLAGLAELAAAWERYGGFLDNEAGYVARMPHEKLSRAAAQLEKEGYRPECYRPYAHAGSRFVAMTWRRDSRKCHWLDGLTTAELSEKNDAAVKEGLEIRDFARDASGRWSALWVAAKPDEGDVRFYVELPYETHEERISAWPRDGFYVERFDLHAPPDAAPLATAIWRKKQEETTDEADVSVYTRSGRTYGELEPGLAQNDLRLEFIDPRGRDRLALYERAHANLADAAKEKPGSDRNTLVYRAAKYQVHSGQFAAALQTLDTLKQSTSSQIPEYRALTLLLMGRTAEAEQEIARFVAVKDARDPRQKEAIGRQLAMMSALVQGDSAAAEQELAALQKTLSTKDVASHELLVQAMALFVRYQPSSANDKTAELRQKAIQSLRELLLRRETKGPEELIEHIQLDGLRDERSFAALARELDLDRRFVAVFSERPEVITRQLYGLTSAHHDAAARELQSDGYSPRVICAAPQVDGDAIQFCSVWEKPAPSFTQSQTTARKIANLAILRAALGDLDSFLGVIADNYGVEARSWAIEGAPAIVPVAAAIGVLRQSSSDRARRNALRLVGTYEASAASNDELWAVGEETTRPASEAGVQMAATWLRRRWNLPAPRIESGQEKSDSPRNWYPTNHGHTMVVLDLREPALIGSASNDPDRVANSERQHWVQVGRQVAFASTETTVRQFEEFLADPQVKAFYANKEFKSSKRLYAPAPDCPQISVRWYDAARYCQWLSEKEGLPKSEWCFPGIWDVEEGPFQLPADMVHRRGYRLPTEAEMELACRGGCLDSRPFGNSTALLAPYVWYSANARGRTREVGWLKPNDFGLFDMLGNVNEWCLDASGSYKNPLGAMDDDEIERLVKPEASRILRGGSFSLSPKDLRSANRFRTVPARENSTTVGFRIARTMTARSADK
jgi:serine/threonine protein kinase/formylglycine-generating enzyme required for sulfatase activity